MLSTMCFLWDTECPLYVYFCFFIIVLIVWQVRQNYQGLKCENRRSCCRRHQKVRQRAKDAASRARRLSREEDEKPCELLSIMKSQSWVPKQGNVRQLLCLDPSCQICEATTLEIRQLLQSKKSQISPALLGLPQRAACLEMPISSESFEWNQDFYSRYSTNSPVVPGNQTLTQLTEELTESTNADGVLLCWTDPLQIGQEFHLADMPMASETLVSPGLEEPVVLMNEEDTVHSNLNYIQQLQDHEALNSQIPFQTLTPQLTVTHPMAVSIVTDAPQPFLSPEVLRLLEIHVKKLMHFQRWGLPRRVEESLKQFMPNPPVYLPPEHNQPVSFILNTSSQDCVHRFEGISPETWYSYMDGQPIQTFWVSEWSSGDQGQRLSCKPIPSPVEKPLLTPDYELLHDLCLSPEGQVDGSQSNLQKKFTQLFCGLPSMHSESLGSTFLCTQGVSKNTLKPPYKEPHFLKVSPPIPLPEAAPPPSSTSPNESLDEPQRAQIGGVPFLTLSECKTLEWHLLQRQLQLQWGLPAVIAKPPRVQSHTQYKHKPWNKAKPRETLKFFGPGKPFSALTRELFFIPQHARRLLEFHLQKRLIHLRWGLPQRIQRSINMLLSSTDLQSLPCGGSRLPNVSISQPGKPEAYGSGDTFLPTAGKGTTPMPHLFAKAQEMLKSHDTKCEQIREGKVPACVQSAWKGRIPGDLAAGTLFPNIPQGQPLELQAENNPDLHQEAVSWKPMDLDQEAQAFSGVFIEHCRRPQALSEETIKKLETTLRHKYLAFLSGLQALYCMAPTKATSPTVDQSVITTMPWSVKSPQKPLSQKSPLEALCLSGLEPCTQDDKETSANIAEEFQHGAQGHGRTEKVPPERQPLLNRPYSLDTEIMERVSFYLKRKALDIKLGISLKESVFQEPTATDLESESVQEPLGSPRESTLLQGPPTLCHVPVAPDPDKVCLKQPATAVQVVFQEQNQPSSRAVPHRSARQGSQVHRNMMEAQVHYVQMGTGGEMLNLGEPFSTESQSPGKSKSGYVPTVAGKRKIPGKPKVVGDLGEGDAGLGFSLVSLKTRQDGEQEKRLLHRQLQGSSLQAQTFHLEGACPHSPQESPELQFADPPPEVFMETDSEQDMEDSQSKESIVPEPARTAKAPQPMLSRASQGLPFPRSPTQRKPSQGQPGPGHVPPGHATPASPYTRPSRLPEAGLKNKMKLFFHSIKLKMKSKAHTEPSTVSTPGKVAKTSKENIDRGLPQAKSPTKKTKPEDFRGPKAQFSVVGPCLTPSYILDSKFWPRPRRVGSVSVLGHSYHCPRHCPRLAYANQQRNPP